MDAFTENVLTRARERQRMLKDYPSSHDGATPLRECNREAVSEPNLTKSKVIHEETRSEPNIPLKLSQTNDGHCEGQLIRQNSITRVCSDLQGSPGQQTKTLNIQKDNFNMEIKVNSADNVRVEVEIEEHCEESNHGSDENFGLREESKNRLKRLGKLYAGGDEADISSPIHRTEAKFYQDLEDEGPAENTVTKPKMTCRKGLSRLADLADTINQWEDDSNHPSRPVERNISPRRAWKSPAPQPPTEKQISPRKSACKSKKPKAPTPPHIITGRPKKVLFSEVAHNRNETGDDNTTPTKTFGLSPIKDACPTRQANRDAVPKEIHWDKKVLDTLESQGFTRTQSSSRLVYSYNSQDNTKTVSEPQRHITTTHLELCNNAILEEDLQEDTANLKTHLPAKNVKNPLTPESPSKHFRSGAIANKAAMFEQKLNESPKKPEKDPALLSLADRKALFEKNKGEALIPKAAFGMAVPVKVDTTMKACESKFIGASKNTVQTHKNIFEVPKEHKDRGIRREEKTKYTAPSPPPAPIYTVPTVAVVHQAGGIASKMAALLENKNKSTISEEQIAKKMKEERQKELDMLLNRFNHNKKMGQKEDEIQKVNSDSDSDSEEETVDERTVMLKERTPKIVPIQERRKSAEKRKSGSRLSSEADSPHVVSVLDDVKRIKIIAPKPGKMYPSLSDIDATTTDPETRTPTPVEENSNDANNYDSDDPNTSFGRDILQAVCKNVAPIKKVMYKDSSSGSEDSYIMDELDEILEEIDDDSSAGPTPPKQARHISPKFKKPQTSNSFHYKSFSPSASVSKSQFQSPNKSIISPRQSMDLPLVVDGDNVMTLTHTVSFYRKQQNEVHTPVKHIVRQPILEETSGNQSTQSDEVQTKISQLEKEVNKQQNIISQTSQALNLCSSTPEFSGSTEQVEAERVLLLATHRRQAAVHELQRLKVEGTIRPLSEHSQNVPLEKGTLTISNIMLPMKQKYVTALAAAGGKGHHVVCLIKCGEQVEPTKLVSTVASNSKNPDVDLYVPGSVILSDIYSDFTVTFEVYCLQAQEECLPHEVKYHINKKPLKGITTPKKSKQDSRLVRPPKESPAGPQAVRTSSFALMGYVVFSVQAVSKRVWSLNNTPSMSPLAGSVEMKITCQLAVSVENRGFLTMFEDVSGFGAWHRRWCMLKGQSLSYWKYPEDEKKKAPIDTIDLKSCITKKVGPVSRDICARLHTFLLERERPAYPQDKDTLVVVRKEDKIVIRHLLSADTKEERIEWCFKLNAALTALRMWGND
ncbi:anillin-like isoform X1 [Euwallacea fornicatus]|uniref:anillin-like isoform X1 n=1 Tax=Euwallacea fornicatus TaxID=995702 RepID=UPI00338EB02A